MVPNLPGSAAITTCPATWLDVEKLFGIRNEPSRCWCRWFAQVLRAARAVAQDGTVVWSVSCFVVSPGHRRSGVAAALPAAAVGHAFGHGAGIVEAYPVDPSLRPKTGSADLYQRTVKLFRAAAFATVSTAVPGRAVMRLQH
ncbi:GNAT family N-acetyltransferase [Arthrobacter sp. FW306-04-A]|uniref:GNAT family N-acetyltransferase n=1 Tax=Arthrobacter sp. FW306-04-A TaxID=2879619 RepID=UPI0037C101B3